MEANVHRCTCHAAACSVRKTIRWLKSRRHEIQEIVLNKDFFDLKKLQFKLIGRTVRRIVCLFLYDISVVQACYLQKFQNGKWVFVTMLVKLKYLSNQGSYTLKPVFKRLSQQWTTANFLLYPPCMKLTLRALSCKTTRFGYVSDCNKLADKLACKQNLADCFLFTVG